MFYTIFFFSEYKSRSPTFSEDSGKHSMDNPQGGLFVTKVQLKKHLNESFGIILAPGTKIIKKSQNEANFKKKQTA